jgi:hypothetical protein
MSLEQFNSSTSFLRVDNLSKSFGGLVVIRGLSLFCVTQAIVCNQSGANECFDPWYFINLSNPFLAWGLDSTYEEASEFKKGSVSREALDTPEFSSCLIR